ncbi:hypothetical protein [Micromonospora sp. WMMD1219]|uniref:hypothetical protein n=1 Tax=Micromonospora sp. WMMD1219 TaxID=3404115 RepID=UPI003BF50E93
MHLSDRQRAALASICDTFAPGDGAGIPSASRLGATEVMAALVLHNPRAAEVRQFLRLLDRWDSPATQFVLGGSARPFSRQSQERRERTLLALAGVWAVPAVVSAALAWRRTRAVSAVSGPDSADT